jgi:hypothetical protein
MVTNLQAMIPRVDTALGIERTPAQVGLKVRAFMSLFIGYLMTSMLFADTDEATDDAVVDAMIAIMGWNEAGTR